MQSTCHVLSVINCPGLCLVKKSHQCVQTLFSTLSLFDCQQTVHDSLHDPQCYPECDPQVASQCDPQPDIRGPERDEGSHVTVASLKTAEPAQVWRRLLATGKEPNVPRTPGMTPRTMKQAPS